MWPFNRAKPDPTPEPLSLEDRIARLESRQDQLEVDWDEVLTKFTRRVASEAAIKRKDLLKTLDRPAAESAPEGQPEATAAVPMLDDYGRVSKRYLMLKAQGMKRA